MTAAPAYTPATLDQLRDALHRTVADPATPDLSARQLAVLLTVHLTQGPHEVRTLAANLNVSKPAITRALDRLGDLDFAVRRTSPTDRRVVVVSILAPGRTYLAKLAGVAAPARPRRKASATLVEAAAA